MDNAVWNTIADYDLDRPMSEYGFSIRLAAENYWTKDFTEKAIREYKKFMYLAATSELMVSPSPIIDVVWHEHLIFTQSYMEFCDLLGKQIQHVPSTHNREDAEKFRLAKERTVKLYRDTFGEQPRDIWHFSGMYESLRLKKAKFKIRSFVAVGLLVFILLTLPAYLLLEPFYLQINGADFLAPYIWSLAAVMILLGVLNRYQFKSILDQADKSSFIFQLRPPEMIYVKSRRLSSVVDGVLNQLLLDKKIVISHSEKISRLSDNDPETLEEYQVYQELWGDGLYSTSIRKMNDKPIFSNIRKQYDALAKYVTKSEKFGQLFYLNFALLGLILLAGFVRLGMGLMRDKPVTLLSIALIGALVIAVISLVRLPRGLSRMLVQRYSHDVRKLKESERGIEWQYFLIGSSVLLPALTSIPGRRDVAFGDSGSTSSSCGTSSGSSCGSSCSSCGGCGGD